MATGRLLDRLLANDFVQVRLRQIPRGSRWTWLAIVRAMAVSDHPGTLQYGVELRASGIVAAVAQITEAEAEEDIATLLRVGLLRRDELGGLVLPRGLMGRVS